MASGLIILAEDDPMLRKLYRDLLQSHGYTVIAARDGSEALVLLSSNVPKLLLLDVMMPGVDGIEVCRRVRPKLGDRVPILFLTALDDIETVRACVAAGGDDYIVKSGSPDALLQRVNHWMQSPKRSMAEVKRRRTIAQVEMAMTQGNGHAASDAATEDGQADEDGFDVNAEVARMGHLVRRATSAAGNGFGTTREQRESLIGYASGVVHQAGDRDSKVRSRAREFVGAVLREAGVMSEAEVDELFVSWERMTRGRRFATAFEHGRRDAEADRKAEPSFVPAGLRAV